MTPFAIVGTVYLILLAICFAVSAASLAVIAHQLRVPVREYRQINAESGADNSEAEQSAASDKTPADLNRIREALGEYLQIPRTSWPTKNGASVEHGEG